MSPLALIASGLGIGFLGSFHCIGMCGPLALALPVQQDKPLQKSAAILLYNLGRASTYALLGFFFGFMGQQIVLIGYQQKLSILIGILILLLLIASLFFNTEKTILGRGTIRLKAALAKLLYTPKGWYSFLGIGLLNGLLPCGLVYLAIATATATGNSLSGALLMFSFGLGTFPLMLALMYFGKFISFQFRSRIRKAIPFVIGLTGVLLILRGLGLGISYISPSFVLDEKHETIHGSCCDPREGHGHRH